MKQEAIQKINKIGKIGAAISQVGRVVVGIAACMMVLASIVLVCIPKEMIQIYYNTGMEIKLDFTEIDHTLTEEEQNSLRESFEGENMDVSMMGNEMVTTSITGDDKQVQVSMESEPVNIFTPGKMMLLMVTAVILLVAIWVSLTFARKFFCGLKECETPFSENIIITLRKLTFSMIPWVILYPLTESFAKFLFADNLEIGINLDALMVVLVLFALTYIFKYGALLQQESDETL